MDDSLPADRSAHTRSLFVFLFLYGTGFANAAEVSHWQLDETSNTVAVDGIGTSNGTYIGGVTLGAAANCGKSFTAARFDGNDDYVEIPHAKEYFLDSGSLNIWVRPDRTDRRQDLFSKDSTGFTDGGHLTLYLDSSARVLVRLQSTSASNLLSVSGAVTANQWTRITVTWGNNGLQLYIDGSLSAASKYTGGLGSTSGGAGNSEPIALGASAIRSTDGSVTPLSDFYQGVMADVRLIDTQLTASEIAALPTCQDAPLTVELGQWLLDESSGTTANDTIGGNNGTYTNGVALGNVGPCGVTDTAAVFDGVDDYLEIPHSDSYLLDDGTVSLWVRPDSTSGRQDVFSKDSSNFDTGGHLTIYLNGTDVLVRLQSTTASMSLTSSSVANVGEWMLVTFTWGSTGMRLYVNGVLGASGSYTGGLGSTSGGIGNFEPIAIGASAVVSGNQIVTPLRDFFEGAIADLRLFNGALTAGEIAALAQCPTPSAQGVARWRLDETSGLVAADSVGSNDGSYENGVTLGAQGQCGIADTAALFDGSNDYVEIPHDDAYLLDDGSVSLWARPDSTSGRQELFSKDSSNFDTGGHITIYLNGDDVQLRMQSTSQSYSLLATNVANAGAWLNVVFTWGSGGMQLFVDGVLRDTDAYTGGLGATSGGVGNFEPIALGANTWSSGNLVVATLRDYFEGAMADVRLFDRALDATEIGDLQNCVAGISGFLLAHDGSGIHCVTEPVTATAVDSGGNPVAGYAQQMTLDTQTGSGDWSLLTGNGVFVDATPDDGLATYTYAVSDNAVATFALSYPDDSTPFDIDVFETADSNVRDNDSEGNLQFAPNGFTFTANVLPNPPPSPIVDPIANQTAARDFLVHITAYGQAADDAQCGVIEDYSGVRAVKFWGEYLDPTSGTRTPVADGTILGMSAVGASNQNVAFSAGQAVVTVSYADAGRIRLYASDDASYANPLSGATNPLVVRPATLFIAIVQSSGGLPNPAATGDTGPAFVPAGEAFTVVVDALDDLGTITPNFGLETAPERPRVISQALVVPAGGRNGSIGDVLSGNNFVTTATPGRFINNDVVFDEAGVIQLRADIADGDYLGSGPLTGTTSGNVGRFYPAQFVLTASSLTPACGNFTYMGQPELAITFTVQAQTTAGGVTENYSAALLGVGAVASVNMVAENANNAVDLGGRINGVTSSWTQGRYSVNAPAAAFTRNALPDGPFSTLQLGVAVDDTLDGSVLVGLDMNPLTAGNCLLATCTARTLGSPNEIVYGRLAVAPNAGPENENLDVPLEAQAFHGTQFGLHQADNCSTYASGSTTLTNFSANLDIGETSVFSPVVPERLLNGADSLLAPLLLSAPGIGNEGSVTVTVDVPAWLEFGWQGAGDIDPYADMAFGRYRGHDRIILWQEL